MNATESSKAYSKVFVFGMHMVRVAHVTTTLGTLICVPSLRLVSLHESIKVHILDIKGSKSVKLLTDAVSFGFGDPFKTAQSTSTVGFQGGTTLPLVETYSIPEFRSFFCWLRCHSLGLRFRFLVFDGVSSTGRYKLM